MATFDHVLFFNPRTASQSSPFINNGLVQLLQHPGSDITPIMGLNHWYRAEGRTSESIQYKIK